MILDTIIRKEKKSSEERKQRRQKLAPAKAATEAADESNWLISYADMMTLLCGFFIMLFSMANLDEPKYDSFKQAMSAQFGGEYVAPDSKSIEKIITQVLQDLGVERQVLLETDPTGIMVTFQSTLFFDTLGTEVKPDGKILLSKLIDEVISRQKELQKNYRIVVEGHADSRQILGGIYPTNWELSAARAARVVRLFLERGFEAKDLVAIGYSDTRPMPPIVVDEFETEPPAPDPMARNRRVVLRIIDSKANNIPLQPKSTQKQQSASPLPQAATSTH